jgi:feruloyl esterase
VLSGLLVAWIALPSEALAQAEGCSSGTMASLNIAGLVFTGGKLAEADKQLPRHCILTGKINERVGVDGKSYAIEFEMRLPADWIEGDNDHLNDFLAKFDFDRDAPKIFAKDATFTEFPMDFMTPPDAASPTLSGLRAANHTMILFHGQADPVFSVNDTIRWYEQLNANSGGKADAFARLFTIPGATHCGGGAGLDRFDALDALTDWVEKGKAPERIVASVNPANKEIPASWSATRSRPLCPWPQYAKYQGGDAESAASFACAAP